MFPFFIAPLLPDRVVFTSRPASPARLHVVENALENLDTFTQRLALLPEFL
jgi:hypothetical protein